MQNNKTSLFIFKSNARGMQYGIGTYISELTQALMKVPFINIFLISYKNEDCREFSLNSISERVTEITFPVPLFLTYKNKSSDKRYASAVVRLLTGVIPRIGKVVFQINYIDDLPIAVLLKEIFNYPLISIVHFAQWQQIFEANRTKLEGLNLDNPTNIVEYTLFKEREMYRISDHIVSVTSYMKDFLINEYGIDNNKITIIPNGLDSRIYKNLSKEERNNIRQSFGFGRDETIVLFSGRIDYSKGVFFLLEAFKEACKYKDNLRLVLLGHGNIQECLQKTQSFFGKITFTGFLPKDHVKAFYQIADIGIAPSIYDHCPYSVLEMMANKIPLIVSRINGLDEILNDSQGIFINPVYDDSGDITLKVKNLSDAILTLAGDSFLRNELATNCYKNFVNKYKASRMAKEMINLILSLNRRNDETSKSEVSKKSFNN